MSNLKSSANNSNVCRLETLLSSFNLTEEISQICNFKEGLRELDVSGGGMKWDDASDVLNIVNELKTMETLNSLKLEGNSLGIEAAKAIGEALALHSDLKSAKWKDLFTGRLKTEIPQALSYLRQGLERGHVQLEELDLSDNAIGPVGMEELQNLLKSPVCYTLKELRLNNCGLGIQGGQMLSNALLECHKSSSSVGKPLSLRVLQLGRNRLENKGAISLAKLFKVLKTLEVVEMPQNGIYFKGFEALAEALALNSFLYELNLNDNTSTEKGAKALANIIPHLPRLKILNLGDCLLKTKGAELISHSLQLHSQELRELHLSANDISLNGALNILECTSNLNNLDLLDLSGNSFGKIDCHKLFSHPGRGDWVHVLRNLNEHEDEMEGSEECLSESEVSRTLDESNDITQEESDVSVVENFFLHPTIVNLLEMSKYPASKLQEYVQAEEKSFSVNWKLEDCLLAFTNYVNQVTLPQEVKSILQFFLSQPQKELQCCKETTHTLLKALYQ